MAKTFDRIAKFLTTPEAKLKYYNDQKVELLLKKNVNKFAEKTEYRARVIGLPRIDHNSSFTTFNEQKESIENELVYVRLDDIDDYFLPDPSTSTVEREGLVTLITSHPLALVSPEVGGNSIKLGDVVSCTFSQNPGNDGKQRGLKVVKILDTSDSEAWRMRMAQNLRSNGLLELASKFEDGGSYGANSGPTNRPDFAGNYGLTPAPVKSFLDDLVKIIKDSNNHDLLPINVGSLYRSLKKQAAIMWNNVVNGANADKMDWFKRTYHPNKSYKSYVDSATVGTNYGFTSPTSANRTKGSKIRKYMQYKAQLILQGGIDGKVSEEKGITDITEIYKDYKSKYQVLPSRHNVGEAVDIRTVNGSRAGIIPKATYPEYTDTQKDKLLELCKQSVYQAFSQLESYPGDKSGEHLHVNVKKE
jgi:hypothetical protein